MAIIAADDLHRMKDDMVAFIAGHGLRRFNGYVGEDIPSIRWESDDNAEGWKDFIELAKECGCRFVTMNDVVLDDLDVDSVIEELRMADFRDAKFLEEAEWLRGFVGKTGFVQIGFACQGVMFLYETSTHWYDRYDFWLDPEQFGLTADDLEADEEEDEDN